MLRKQAHSNQHQLVLNINTLGYSGRVRPPNQDIRLKKAPKALRAGVLAV